MKITVFILLFCSSGLMAQDYEWAHGDNCNRDAYGRAVVSDNSGNVYVAGYFKEGGDFDPGPGVANITATTRPDGMYRFDAFIKKVDASGNLVWIKTLESTEDVFILDATIDNQGNLYFVGQFQDSVDFDPGPTVQYGYAQGSSDAFLLKLDGAGNLLFFNTFGGASADICRAVRLDNSGNIYMTGAFSGTVDFDPGVATLNLVSNGDSDVFIASLNSAGGLNWAKSFGDFLDDYGFGLALDNAGNVFVSGSFNIAPDFDPGSGTTQIPATGQPSIFVEKLDNAGNFVWAKVFGSNNESMATDIEVNDQGDVYTIGRFNSQGDFDPNAGTATLTTSGYFDSFVQKMNNNGDFLWAKSFGGLNQDWARGSAIDGDGNVYVTGYFEGDADFDPGVGSDSSTAAGQRDIYIQKLDDSGNHVWTQTFGADGFDEGLDVHVDDNDYVYTTGYFMRTVDFDPGPQADSISTGQPSSLYRGHFIQKLSQQTATSLDKLNKHIDVQIFPNPNNGMFTVLLKQPLEDVQISITDLQGKVIYRKHFDVLSSQQIEIHGQSGLYFMHIQTEYGHHLMKLVKD